MFWRFEAIEQKIKESDKKQAKDSAQSSELGEIICGEGISKETLREKLSTAFPFVLEDDVTNKLSKDNIIEETSATEVVNKETTREKLGLEENAIYNIPGNLAEECLVAGVVNKEAPREKFSAAFPRPFSEESGNDSEEFSAMFSLPDSLFSEEANATNKPGGSLQRRVEDLKRELIDENKCDVKVSDFHGLQDEINSAEDNIPDRLKPIAMKIEQDRGECTPANDFYQQLLVLVSAAVKEMQELSDKELNMPILRKSRVRAGHRASAARARVVGNSPEGLHVGSTRLVRALSWSSESIYALARDAWDVRHNEPHQLQGLFTFETVLLRERLWTVGYFIERCYSPFPPSVEEKVLVMLLGFIEAGAVMSMFDLGVISGKNPNNGSFDFGWDMEGSLLFCAFVVTGASWSRASAARARVVGNSPEGLHVGSTRLVRAMSWSSESIYALARDAWDVVSRWIPMKNPTAFMLRCWKLGL
ncbi:uncharacterized protein LOC120150899 [Hibiscus syriacus]|uniref:uncharacterized protein LOC120150899 n=1 Tax=Hibiscus syriacus TaxID=106335 RepID=UPI0019207A6B|nr:uncharacterized protein LOC120150899 [Hibiscus syriacus]